MTEFDQRIGFFGPDHLGEFADKGHDFASFRFFRVRIDIIDEVDFQPVQSIIVHDVFHFCELSRKGVFLPAVDGVFTFLVFGLETVGILSFEFAFCADQERCHPEHIFHAHRLNAVAVIDEIGEFLRGKVPVADPFIPVGNGLRGNAFHDIETPAVVDDQRSETEFRGDLGIFFDPVLRDGGMDRIPGAEDRFPGACGEFLHGDVQLFAPVGERFGPGDRPLVEDQFEIRAFRMQGQEDRHVVGTFFLVHFCIETGVVDDVGQPEGEPVVLPGSQERQEREIALSGAFAFDGPMDLRGGRAQFRMPVAVNVQDRYGETDLHDAVVSRNSDWNFAVVSGMFELRDLGIPIDDFDFHFLILSMNFGLIRMICGEGGAFPSSRSASRPAA